MATTITTTTTNAAPLIEDMRHNFSKAVMHVHPSISDYYTHITPFITLSMFIASLLFLLNLSIFFTTLQKLRKELHKSLLNFSIVLCFIYPLISLAALVTILVPKSWLICHTVMHLSFTVGAVLFQRLCFRYVNSEASFLKQIDGTGMAINTPPCCCLCGCLPAIMPSKGKFCILRYMIWQMPFIQGSVMLILNVIYYKEPDLYMNSMYYFIPFIVCSILVGLWALNITVRMVHSMKSDCGVMRKMLCLQLILLLCKLQYLLFDSQLDSVQLGDPNSTNHTIYKQAIINLLILTEMVPVSMLAQSTYTIPVSVPEK